MRRTGADSCYWCRIWLAYRQPGGWEKVFLGNMKDKTKYQTSPTPFLLPWIEKKEISDSELGLDPFANDATGKFLLFPGLLVLKDLLYFSLGIRLTWRNISKQHQKIRPPWTEIEFNAWWSLFLIFTACTLKTLLPSSKWVLRAQLFFWNLGLPDVSSWDFSFLAWSELTVTWSQIRYLNSK